MRRSCTRCGAPATEQLANGRLDARTHRRTGNPKPGMLVQPDGRPSDYLLRQQRAFAGDAGAAPEQTDLAEVARARVEQWEPLADESGVPITVTAPAEALVLAVPGAPAPTPTAADSGRPSSPNPPARAEPPPNCCPAARMVASMLTFDSAPLRLGRPSIPQAQVMPGRAHTECGDTSTPARPYVLRRARAEDPADHCASKSVTARAR